MEPDGERGRAVFAAALAAATEEGPEGQRPIPTQCEELLARWNTDRARVGGLAEHYQSALVDDVAFGGRSLEETLLRYLLNVRCWWPS